MKLFRSNRLQGSYLVDRDGNIFPVDMHVPSTTFLDRGLAQLSLTDVEFLLTQGRISDAQARNAIAYWFNYYIDNELGHDHGNYSIIDIMTFVEWAELKYAPEVKEIAMPMLSSGDINFDEAKYITMNNRWYNELVNQFTKLTVYGKNVEFRIQSNDGYDWNKVIIGDVVPNNESQFRDCKFTVLRESTKGYKAYCMNVSMSELISDYDKTVMSTTDVIRRKDDDGNITYS